MRSYRTCLLVDDNTLDNHINSKLISRSDFATEILAIERPREALKLLQKGKFQPEIIFLNVKMAGMNGFDFLDEYEKLDIEKGKTKIVMLTSSLAPFDSAHAEHYKHISKYITNTLTPEILLELAS